MNKAHFLFFLVTLCDFLIFFKRPATGFWVVGEEARPIRLEEEGESPLGHDITCLVVRASLTLDI